MNLGHQTETFLSSDYQTESLNDCQPFSGLGVLLCGQVFLRESLEHRLEKQREVEVLKAAMIIQAHVLGYIAR